MFSHLLNLVFNNPNQIESQNATYLSIRAVEEHLCEEPSVWRILRSENRIVLLFIRKQLDRKRLEEAFSVTVKDEQRRASVVLGLIGIN